MVHPTLSLYRLDHESALFAAWNAGSTLITMIPVLLDRYVEGVTAALHCYTATIDDERAVLHQPGSGRGLVANFGRRAPLTLHCDN
jgi:hypothetical protein